MPYLRLCGSKASHIFVKCISFDNERFEEKAAEVVNRYKDKDPFGNGLGYGLGGLFPSLDPQLADRIWSRLLNLLRTNIKVGFAFGYGIAQKFPFLHQEIKDRIWSRLVNFKLEDDDFLPDGYGEGAMEMFAGFAESIAQIFESISERDFKNILELGTKYNEFGIILGSFCGLKLKYAGYDILMKERIMGHMMKNRSFAIGFGSTINETFKELDGALQQELLDEAERNSIFYHIAGFDRCEFCREILKNDFNYFTKHMFAKHYDIVKKNIPNADDILQECEICKEIIKGDINELIKHSGEKHYDSLPEPMKESYDKWKANGFPKIIMDYDTNKEL